jgi:leader peptidase (prepilin peptidase)/N-methyltransferase
VDPLFAIAIFAFGLVFGSFLNVCIHRMPRRILLLDDRDQLAAEMAADPATEPVLGPEIERLDREIASLSVAAGRSACPACRTPIRALDNIPVVSWLLLGGRCRQCRAPISPRYVAVELLTALLFLGCYARFGLSLLTLKLCVFCFLLLGLIFTDAEWKLLPDALTLPGIVLGLLFSIFVPVNDQSLRLFAWIFGLGVDLPLRPESWLVSLEQSALGAVVGAGFIYGAGFAYLRARGVEGMGLGDVKLMAMVGAFLGVAPTVFTIFAASLLGAAFGLGTMVVVWLRRTRRRMARLRESAAVARRRAWRSATLVYRHHQVPFGVFLGAVALVAAFFGNALIWWYWRRFL